MIFDVDTLNARILIVDDNQSNVELLEAMLTRAGYTSVLSITDPREALQLYKSYQPDLILLDINMPHLNGYQVMEQLNEVRGGDYLSILVLTAHQDGKTRLRSLEYGAKNFITKPFNHLETLTIIRNMLEVRLLHNKVQHQNEVLEDEVRARTRELHDTRLEIIYRLGLAAEYRDNDTGLHIIRMSKMSMLLGKVLGLTDSKAALILQASPMHDVGKIGIPDRVLLKPGRLDRDEWEIMKTHSTIGAKVLEGHSSDLLQMAKEIALSHHEKWDGSGYPGGLKGEEIPQSGRICALADVFDALTSVRPYKKAWSIENAVAQSNDCKGSHFDPKLVDIFNTITDGFISIKEQYKELDSF